MLVQLKMIKGTIQSAAVLLVISLFILLLLTLDASAKEDSSYGKEPLGNYLRMPIRRAGYMRPWKFLYRSQDNDYDADREIGWPFIPKRSGVDPLFGVTVGKRSIVQLPLNDQADYQSQ
ncbi:uncharacterized protein LOC107360081 [Tetranychus urticae]|uniref:Uncharacterized protein n=1 Tax=Tetranychus urticae TaxID=32264 RepID=T1JTL0_TETUR|nr:uncharacterized protein LOC107360081 [Tetranychus urticae]